MHILYKLIETKQLPTYEDVKYYLAYTIKINQLTGKYKWISILIYDEYSLELLKHDTHFHGLSIPTICIQVILIIPQLKLDQSRGHSISNHPGLVTRPPQNWLIFGTQFYIPQNSPNIKF